MSFAKFVTRPPHPQNAVDLFEGHWAFEINQVLPEVTTGAAGSRFDIFDRTEKAARLLGNENGSLSGMTVLELGPLEAAHTWQLTKLGAEHVTAVEANAEAFLKCLIVKEILGIRNAEFLLGDCMEYMRRTDGRFDLVFCSGILYHMSDPFDFLQAIARLTDRVFVWTHVFNPDHPPPITRTPRAVRKGALDLTYHEDLYSNMDQGTFWGGNQALNCWLTREDLGRVFEALGFDFTVVSEELTHPHGAALTGIAKRRGAS